MCHVTWAFIIADFSFYLDNDKVARFATPGQGFFRWGNLPGANIWAHANNAPFDKEVRLLFLYFLSLVHML